MDCPNLDWNILKKRKKKEEKPTNTVGAPIHRGLPKQKDKEPVVVGKVEVNGKDSML